MKRLSLTISTCQSTRFELTFLETSAQSFPTNYASFITCDSAEAVPASPTSPTATNNKTGINLAWTDASSDETGFKVYRKLSDESEAKLIATQTAVTYLDTDLTEGQTAYYHVIAYNDNGVSAQSKTVSETADFTAPTVVSTDPSSGAVIAKKTNPPEIIVSVTFSERVTTYLGDAANGYLLSYRVNEGDYGTAAAVTSRQDSIRAVVPYEANSTYQFKIGKDYIIDMSDQVMEEDYIWTFTTP